MDISEKALEGLDETTRAQVQSCESATDLVALAAEKGVELSDEQIEAISGGSIWEDDYSCDTYRYY